MIHSKKDIHPINSKAFKDISDKDLPNSTNKLKTEESSSVFGSNKRNISVLDGISTVDSKKIKPNTLDISKSLSNFQHPIIIPELAGLDSPELDILETYTPVDPAHFSFLLNITFTRRNFHCRDYYCTIVCSKAALMSTIENHTGIFNARNHLVMPEYSFAQLETYIKQYTHTCFAKTEVDVCYKLSGIGEWEFENYQSEFEETPELSALSAALSSSTIENLATYKPQNPDNFGFELDIAFTSRHTLRTYNFKVHVCNKQWLYKHIDTHKGIFNTGNYLIMTHYNFDELQNYIMEYAHACSEKNIRKPVL